MSLEKSVGRPFVVGNQNHATIANLMGIILLLRLEKVVLTMKSGILQPRDGMMFMCVNQCKLLTIMKSQV